MNFTEKISTRWEKLAILMSNVMVHLKMHLTAIRMLLSSTIRIQVRHIDGKLANRIRNYLRPGEMKI